MSLSIQELATKIINSDRAILYQGKIYGSGREETLYQAIKLLNKQIYKFYFSNFNRLPGEPSISDYPLAGDYTPNFTQSYFTFEILSNLPDNAVAVINQIEKIHPEHIAPLIATFIECKIIVPVIFSHHYRHDAISTLPLVLVNRMELIDFDQPSECISKANKIIKPIKINNFDFDKYNGLKK